LQSCLVLFEDATMKKRPEIFGTLFIFQEPDS